VIVQCPPESFMASVDGLPVPMLDRPTAMQDWVLAQEMPLNVLLPATARSPWERIKTGSRFHPKTVLLLICNRMHYGDLHSRLRSAP
jgi:hypothetical protein